MLNEKWPNHFFFFFRYTTPNTFFFPKGGEGEGESEGEATKHKDTSASITFIRLGYTVCLSVYTREQYFFLYIDLF